MSDIGDKEEFLKFNPCLGVQMIHHTLIYANDYNPNVVAPQELKLLYLSIKKDGYTMPVVVCPDGKGKYVIVDGFHRYTILLRYSDIMERNKGYLPCSIINKDLAGRMAATVRHNRARGAHIVAKDADVILRLKKEGKTDNQIIKELGMTSGEFDKKVAIYRINDLVNCHAFSFAKDQTNDI